ncbi:MAG: rhomboid family intramembrane serine protease [Saprospiraceae bacterium]|nr:rhomboid family intramembrane serine protease [Saprospiraceae bacterium]
MISLTLVLIIMTCLISYQAFNNSIMKARLMFYPSQMKKSGEWYRFFSHGLVHADWQHLIVNMYVLYVFGEDLEFAFLDNFGAGMGRTLYLIFYFSAVVISAVPSYFKHQDNPSYAAVGASGATSALLFASILFNPWHWFLFPPMPAVLFGITYLWYSSYMEKKGIDNIAHNAHFWGAVYGLFFMIVTANALQPSLLESFLYRFLQGPHWP